MHSLEEYCRRQSTEWLHSVIQGYFQDVASYTTDVILVVLTVLLEREPDNEDYHAAWFALNETHWTFEK